MGIEVLFSVCLLLLAAVICQHQLAKGA